MRWIACQEKLKVWNCSIPGCTNRADRSIRSQPGAIYVNGSSNTRQRCHRGDGILCETGTSDRRLARKRSGERSSLRFSGQVKHAPAQEVSNARETEYENEKVGRGPATG